MARSLAREMRAVIAELAGDTPVHRRFHARLRWLALIVIGADLAAALLVHFVIPDDRDGDVRTMAQALQWSTQHLLSGGSSFGHVSDEMRWVELVLEIIGITAVAALAGTFGAFFHRRDLEVLPLDPASTDPPSFPERTPRATT